MITKSALALLKVYKFAVSPYLPSTCIYQPTCSEYAAEAIELHGVMKGVWIGIKRIARCNPFTTGGLDPVPAVNEGSYRTDSRTETDIR
jgi:putative membrane protein insertion efficiency factor